METRLYQIRPITQFVDHPIPFLRTGAVLDWHIPVLNVSNTQSLPCPVREKVITYIRDHHPDMLPKSRLAFLDERSLKEYPLTQQKADWNAR